MITSLGVVVTFKCGFFNVGAQGQFYVGAIAAAYVCDALRGAPVTVVVPLAIAAAVAGGAAWALWPGLLRLRSGTDEVITTLMGNFIATLILLAVVTGPLKDPAGAGQSSSSRRSILPTASVIRAASRCRSSSSRSRPSWSSGSC